MRDVQRTGDQGDLSSAMDRLEQIIEANGFWQLRWHIAEVIDLSRWAAVGESYVKVAVEGDNGDPKWAIYRDGPSPTLGQKLMVRRMSSANASQWLALPLPLVPTVTVINAENPSCFDDTFLISARGPGGDVILKLEAGNRDFLSIVGNGSNGTGIIDVPTYNGYPYDPYYVEYPPGALTSVISPPHWIMVSSSPVSGQDVRPLFWVQRYQYDTVPFVGFHYSGGNTYPAWNPRYFTYGHNFAHDSGVGLYYSDDHGSTWTQATGITGVLHVVQGSYNGPHPDPFGYMLAVGDNGEFLYDSRDFGATWDIVPNSTPYDGSSWRYVDRVEYITAMFSDGDGNALWYDFAFENRLNVGHRVMPNYRFSGLTTSGRLVSNNRFQNFWWSDIVDPVLTDADVQFGNSRKALADNRVLFNPEHLTNRNEGTLLPADVHLPYVKGSRLRNQFGPITPGASGMVAYNDGYFLSSRFGATVSGTGSDVSLTYNKADTSQYLLTEYYPAPFNGGDGTSYPGNDECWANVNLVPDGDPSFLLILNGNEGGGAVFNMNSGALDYWNVLNNHDAATYRSDFTRNRSYDNVAALDATINQRCMLVSLANGEWKLARRVGGGSFRYQDSPDADFFTYFIGYDPPKLPPVSGFTSTQVYTFRNGSYGSVFFEEVSVGQVADLGGAYTASRLGITSWVTP